MAIKNKAFENPFRPGAGHMPPHLAGRKIELHEFGKLLSQKIILENMVLTGLRGVGKTVLLETMKPIANAGGWMWLGTDLSEAASINEEKIAQRIITDIALVTSSLTVKITKKAGMGFTKKDRIEEQKLNYNTLVEFFNMSPGLVSDKLKALLEMVWSNIGSKGINGIIFAYDESQTLSDHPSKEQYPLALLLDVFQSIQRKNIPFMLILTGLPTLFPKLVEARTFAERMFKVVFLKRLTDKESKDAILKPIKDQSCPITLTKESVDLIVKTSAGYPYFIQFICREVYEVFSILAMKGDTPSVPIDEITRKLDNDFFAGRWARATDRQRELLIVVANLPSCDNEFTLQEVVEKSKSFLPKGFSTSHASQMLSSLANNGLVYKNRHGKYSFAVPLLGQFIKRQKFDTSDKSVL